MYNKFTIIIMYYYYGVDYLNCIFNICF